MLRAMRMIASLILAVALALASISAAGVAPMGGAAHQHAMKSGHHGVDGTEGSIEAAKCPASIIGCGGIGLTPEAERSGALTEAESEPWRPETTVVLAHEPNLEAPPPKA